MCSNSEQQLSHKLTTENCKDNHRNEYQTVISLFLTYRKSQSAKPLRRNNFVAITHDVILSHHFHRFSWMDQTLLKALCPQTCKITRLIPLDLHKLWTRRQSVFIYKDLFTGSKNICPMLLGSQTDFSMISLYLADSSFLHKKEMIINCSHFLFSGHLSITIKVVNFTFCSQCECGLLHTSRFPRQQWSKTGARALSWHIRMQLLPAF